MAAAFSDTKATSLDHVVNETTSGGSSSPKTGVTCQSSYRLRKLKNRGALLILVINYLVTCVFYHLSVHEVGGKLNKYYATAAWCLTLPIVGWLADIYFTRYKVIRCSMWIMWVTSILSTVSFIISQMVDKYSQMNKYITRVVLIFMGFGFGGYQANAILFGLDQLHDASTEEITSFISWYVWTFLCSGVVVHFTHACLRGEYFVFNYFWVCICLSLALILLLLLHKSLLKEPPATQKNPFRLIHNVLQYAVKNKHPRMRSAFTYCGNEHPSRIDFGKTKYGGPFTTEQVEDVKTFLRMLVVISVSSALFGNLYAAEQLREKIFKSLVEEQMCSKHHVWYHSIYLVTLAFIPLHEFIFYPLLHKYIYRVKSICKFMMGAVLQILRLCILVAFELTSRRNFMKRNEHNATMPCIFMLEKSALESTLKTTWLSIPNTLNYISVAIYAIAAFEFICSQSPYSMRGLLTGVEYACMVLINLIVFGLVQPFTMRLSAWGTGIISCGFWFLMFMILLTSVVFAALCVVVKWYRYRKREDVLPNEHIFAEQYYAKKIGSMYT